MKVSELIKELEKCDPEINVFLDQGPYRITITTISDIQEEYSENGILSHYVSIR